MFFGYLSHSGITFYRGPPKWTLSDFFDSLSQEPTLALPGEVKQLSQTLPREKLVKIGAKVVSHGRYVTFQLAEVAVPRELFQEILRLIDGLRPAPLPP